MAAGDVVNTTSRLQAAAPASGVLVGETTFRATREAIDDTDAEAVEAKGKSEPVRVWEAVGARARVTTEAVSTAAPLVGRERELAVLKELLVRVLEESSPQLVTLAGVPGIGKSRLVHELEEPPPPRRPRCAYRGNGGAPAARPRLRGSALGGRRAAGLRRPPRRVGERRSDPHRRHRTAGAPRAATCLGRRQAQCDDALARAAVGDGHEPPARKPARPAAPDRGDAEGLARAGGRQSALRRAVRADARRGSRRRRPARPGIDSGRDRGAPGPAPAGREGTPPGRLRARQGLLARGRRRRTVAARRRGGADSATPPTRTSSGP
jgi:hypothetical protein